MARKRSDRRDSFQGLWPWPGNIFVVLFGAWALYMGSIAGAADVERAFYGLAGIAALVLLLGLRTIGRASVADEDRAPARMAPRTEEVSFPPAPAPVESRPPQSAATRTAPGRTPAQFPDARPAGPNVDALLNREKATRGAQIAKLEGTVNERLKRIEARLGTDGDAPDLPALDEYLRIETFNAAVNERLLPRIREMITSAVDERMTPEAVKAAAGGDAALAQDVADLKASREATQRDVADLRAALEAGTGQAAEGDTDGATGATVAGLLSRLQTLEAAEGERRGQVEALAAGMREAVGDMGRHLKRVDEFAADIMRRLERMETGGEAARTPADVNDLRHALETIIEQTRDIRARQEMLSARFETPVPSGGAQDGGSASS